MNMTRPVCDYIERLYALKLAFEKGVWNQGDIRVKQAFARMFFDLSVMGKELAHQLKLPVDVPDVVELDADGTLVFCLKRYDPRDDICNTDVSCQDSFQYNTAFVLVNS